MIRHNSTRRDNCGYRASGPSSALRGRPAGAWTPSSPATRRQSAARSHRGIDATSGARRTTSVASFTLSVKALYREDLFATGSDAASRITRSSHWPTVSPGLTARDATDSAQESAVAGDSVMTLETQKPSAGTDGNLWLNHSAGEPSDKRTFASPPCHESSLSVNSGAFIMPTIREITAAVADLYGVASADLAAHKSARAPDAKPRLLVMWLARQCTPYTLARIGRHFGGRDHKTVSHAVQRIEQMMQTDRNLAQTAAQLRGALV